MFVPVQETFDEPPSDDELDSEDEEDEIDDEEFEGMDDGEKEAYVTPQSISPLSYQISVILLTLYHSPI